MKGRPRSCNSQRGAPRCASLLALCLLAACGGSSGDAEDAPRRIEGAVSKGPLAGAIIELYALDAAGNRSGAALQSTQSDANGAYVFDNVPFGGPLLLVSRGGRFADESDQTGQRSLTLSDLQGLESVLLPGESSAAITPLSQALLIRARREAASRGLLAVLNDLRAGFDQAFGFDPLGTIPANPVRPAGTLAERRYAMTLGGVANHLNAQALELGLPLMNYELILRFAEDLSDGEVDGRQVGVRLEVGTQKSQLPPGDFNAAIRLFRNNNDSEYAGLNPVQLNSVFVLEPPPAVPPPVLPTPGEPLPTSAPSPTPSPTANPEPSASALPSAAPSPEPSPTATPAPTATPTPPLPPPPPVGGGGGGGGGVLPPPPPVNAAPMASNDMATLNAGSSITIDVLANDTDAEDGTPEGALSIGSPPANGVAVVEPDRSIRYTPNANFDGNESFSYQVQDRNGLSSNAATVNLTIKAAPVASDDTAVLDEDTDITIKVLSNDTDVEDGIPGGGLRIDSPPANGLALVEPDRSITYTPSEDFNGSDSFRYQVLDNDGLVSNAALVNLTVRPINDPPLIAPVPDQTMIEDAVLVLTLSLSDVDGDALTVNATSGSQALIMDSGLIVSGSGDNRSLSISPEASASGSTTISLSASDGTSIGAASFMLTVTAADDDDDRDGLLDSEEAALGTDPLNADSDDDGVTDFEEVNQDGDPTSFDPSGRDTNPLDMADTPANNLRRLASHIPADPLSTGDFGVQAFPMSADGRFTVFFSSATDLAPSPSPAPKTMPDLRKATRLQNIYSYDFDTQTVTLVSHAQGNTLAEANGNSGNFATVAISADGQLIAYTSNATDLTTAADANGGADIFIWDRASNTNTLVTHRVGEPGVASAAAAPTSTPLSLSADGRFLAYAHAGTDLSSDSDGDNNADVFVYDRQTNSSRLISQQDGNPGLAADGIAVAPLMSADGRSLVFLSDATNLVDPPTSGAITNIYRHDLQTGSTKLVSRQHGSNVEGNAGSVNLQYAISSHGMQVVFASNASNLRGTDSNGSSDVFLYDASDDSVRIVSHTAGDPLTTANGQSLLPTSGHSPVISAFASRVLIQTAATDLVAGVSDINGGDDLYLYSLQDASLQLISHRNGDIRQTAATDGLNVSYISSDGDYILLNHLDDGIAPGLTNAPASTQCYLYQLSTRTAGLLSHEGGDFGRFADQFSSGQPSADASRVQLFSNAGNLILGQGERNLGAGDVFIFDTGIAPTAADGDTDGIPDHLERAYGLDPANPDSDGDGLTDGLELNSHQTQAARADSDGDGVSDHDEIIAGTAPNDPRDPTPARQLASHVPGNERQVGNQASDLGIGSADGRYTVFNSAATNLVAGTTTSRNNTYLHDRMTGQLTLISHQAGNPNQESDADVEERPWMSADGNFVVFRSAAGDLTSTATPDGNGEIDLFLWDRQSNTSTLVSHALGSVHTGGNGASAADMADPISADGRFVVYGSTANNLDDANDSNALTDIYLFDRLTGENRLLSHVHDDAEQSADKASTFPRISADGRRVVFRSSSSNLVASGVSGDFANIYVQDLPIGRTKLVSRVHGTVGEGNGNAGASFYSISANGTSVAFESAATNLGGAGSVDSNGSTLDIFHYNYDTDAVRIVSHTAGDPLTTAAGLSTLNAITLKISGDGRWIVFESLDGSIDPNAAADGNGMTDAFLYDTTDQSNQLLSHVAGNPALVANMGVSSAFISPDGRQLSLNSLSQDIASGINGVPTQVQTYRYDRLAQSATLLSHRGGAPQEYANGESLWLPNADGSVFQGRSEATDLLTGQLDANGASDIFAFDGGVAAVSSDGDGDGLSDAVEAAFGLDPANPDTDGDGLRDGLEVNTLGTQAARADSDGDGVGDFEEINQDGDATGLNLAGGDSDPNDVSSTPRWLLSHTPNMPRNGGGNFGSSIPSSVSAEGRYAVFDGASRDLVPGLTGDFRQVYLHDRSTQALTLVSHALNSPGVNGNGDSSGAKISADGRYVYYNSLATNLAGSLNDNGSSDIFIWDRVTDNTTLVSHAFGNPLLEATGGASFGTAPSGDGRYLSYTAGDVVALVGGSDGNGGANDVLVYDRLSNTSQLISHSFDTPSNSANGNSLEPRISANGRKVAYLSEARDLVASGTTLTGIRNGFVYDLPTKQTKLVSRKNGTSSEATAQSANGTQALRISGDGSAVYFSSNAADIRGTDTNPGFLGFDLFRFDTASEEVRIVSHTALDTETTASADSNMALLDSNAVSSDGRYFLYQSNATDLVAGQVDTNGVADIFIYDALDQSNILVSHIDGQPLQTTSANTFAGNLSADGRFAVIFSGSTALVSGVDIAGSEQSFIYDRAARQARLLSHAAGTPSTGANAQFTGNRFFLSADGAFAYGATDATNLIAGFVNNNGDTVDAYLLATGVTAGSSDTDGDGLTATVEAARGLNPNNPDTDADGLSDGAEVNTFGTSAGLPDSDGDTVNDGDEVNTHGTDPLDAASFPPPLLVSATTPATHEFDVLHNITPVLTFNQDVDPASVDVDSVRVFSEGARLTAFGSPVATLGANSTITFMQNLRAGSTVWLSATAAIKDDTGTLPLRPHVLEFRARVTGTGRGLFSEVFATGDGVSVGSVSLVDLDGDGNLDLMRDSNLQLGDGLGGTMLGGGNLPGSGRSLAFDMDGDGDPDLLRHQSTTFTTYLNTGVGIGGISTSPTQSAIAIAAPGGSGTNYAAASYADFNGDGALDLVFGTTSGTVPVNAVFLNLNDGSGRFGASRNAGTACTREADEQRVPVGDFDRDGDIDILLACDEGHRVAFNDGKANFSEGPEIGTGQLRGAVGLGDVDGDGDLDYVHGPTGSAQIRLWLNNGSGVFTDGGVIGQTRISRAILLGDFDSDGDLDLTVVGSDAGVSQKCELFGNDGVGTFAVRATIPIPCSSLATAQAAGDIDRDGDLDLAININGTGPDFLYLNNAGLNDTAADFCADSSTNFDVGGSPAQKSASCATAVTTHPGQDGVHGRDANARAGTLRKRGAGAAGFDFTKICNSGEAAGEGSCPADPGLGTAADEWACNRDNASGLIWEVKVNDASNTLLRDTSHFYHWRDTNSATNGGNSGSVGNSTICNNTLSGIGDGNCNTQNYVAGVNAANLCGANDWRLPTVNELESIHHRGQTNALPSIDTTFFPNTIRGGHWTATTLAIDPSGAFGLNFHTSVINANGKSGTLGIFVVRDAP